MDTVTVLSREEILVTRVADRLGLVGSAAGLLTNPFRNSALWLGSWGLERTVGRGVERERIPALGG